MAQVSPIRTIEWRAKPPPNKGVLRQDRLGRGIVMCFPIWDNSFRELVSGLANPIVGSSIARGVGREGSMVIGTAATASDVSFPSGYPDPWLGSLSEFTIAVTNRYTGGLIDGNEFLVTKDNAFDFRTFGSPGSASIRWIVQATGGVNSLDFTPVDDGDWHIWGGLWRASTVQRTLEDHLFSTDTTGIPSGTLGSAVGELNLMNANVAAGFRAFVGDISLVVAWGRALELNEWHNYIDNPHQIWKPRRLFLVKQAGQSATGAATIPPIEGAGTANRSVQASDGAPSMPSLVAAGVAAVTPLQDFETGRRHIAPFFE